MQAMWKEILTPYNQEKYSFEKEISQENNPNANARLWIQPNNTVLKVYSVWNNQTKSNNDMLQEICRVKQLFSMREIAMPLQILFENNVIIGFTMPYYTGIHLDDYLSNPLIPSESKLHCLIKLAEIINAMPKDVFIGDLHGKNILVESNDNIHIIDIDGFSIKGHEQTCPLKAFSARKDILGQRKYHHFDGSLKISRDTDIFCFFIFFLEWIMGGINFMAYTRNEINEYLDYIGDKGFPREIKLMINRLFDRKHNYIEPNVFESINLSLIGYYSYPAYVKSQELSSW